MIKYLFCCIVTFTASYTALAEPNVVIIFADDLGLGDLGAYNSDSKIPTPNMNRIAKQGIRCTDAHSASSVCTPSRYALLTGRYAWRTSLKSWVLGGKSPLLIEEGRPTMPAAFQGAGWTTAGVGKWHLGLGRDEGPDFDTDGVGFNAGPLTTGFDQYEGIPASLDMDPYVWITGDRAEAAPTETMPGGTHRRQDGQGYWRGGKAAPGFCHAEVLPRTIATACQWIEEMAEVDKPFFLYVPLSAPHTPWVPNEPFKKASHAGYYGDFVTEVDAGIGAIDAALQAAGVSDNTILVITSDNGAHWNPDDIEHYRHMANGHVRGQKADIWEGGHRVPLVIRWPGHLPPDSTVDQTLCLTDLWPTLATATGVRLPAGAAPDGVDMWPVLTKRGPANGQRQAIVHHSGGGMFAIRSGSWKLIEGLGSGGFSHPKNQTPEDGQPSVQLYDLEHDPLETKNLAAMQPQVVKQLSEMLNEIRSGEDRTRTQTSEPKAVKVFILAGQSNMEGKGAVKTLPWLGQDEEHGHLLKTIQNEDGSWRTRDDVWIDYLGRRGPLGVGFGSEGSHHGPLIGPEYGFGMVVGDHFEQPVVLIKTAWGGKDVANDFQAPGSGGPGPFYVKSVEHIQDVLKNMDTYFPDLKGRPYEIAGIVWFQGWNDMVDEQKRQAYTENLAQMLRDLRRDLGAPNAPVVIGELGVDGHNAKGNIAKFRQAQAAVAELPDLKGNVVFTPTSPYYDQVAHQLFEDDVWKGPDKERYYEIASDRPYHYLGSGKIYFLMGHAFGRDMVKLQNQSSDN